MSQNLLNTTTLNNSNVVEFALNEPQGKVHMIRANRTVLLWGRGTGKTVGGIGPWIINLAQKMPGSLVGLFGRTHEQLSKNIVPKILLGFTQLGYRQDVDFVVGRKPPAHWPKCVYSGIKKWDKTFVWKTGMVVQQITLHEKGDANAFDFQAAIFDEAKYDDPVQIEDEVIPTLRGFEDKFGHLPEYLSVLYATDKMFDFLRLQWLLNLRNEVDHDAVNKIMKHEYLISEMQQSLQGATATQIKKVNHQIKKLNQINDKIRMKLTYVSEASAIDNLDNLGIKWLANKKKQMTPYVFNVAILNHDPIHSQEQFYHALNDSNFYTTQYANADFDLNKPTIVALDYQHSVAPLLVAQVNSKVNGLPALNFINEFDTVYPHGIVECIKNFCDYYKPLGLRRVYYIHDQTAKGRRAGADPLFKIVINAFKKNKVLVREVYMGDTPDHFDKYLQINEALAGNKWIPIQFNQKTIINARQSIVGAGTKTTNGVTKKDKELENAGKYPSVDQTKTTHYSDVFDQIAWCVLEQKKINYAASKAGGGMRTR